MPTGLQTTIQYNEHGGYTTVPVQAMTWVTNERIGPQFVANPAYIAPGLYTTDEAKNLASNIDFSKIKNATDFFALFNVNRAAKVTPITYAGDRGGNASGGTAYFSSAQIAANARDLNTFGLSKGYIDNKTGWFEKAFETVVEGVVVLGIGAGVAGVAGVGPAATGGSSGATAATAAGGNVGVASGSTVIAPSTTAAGSAGIGAGAPAVAAGGGGLSTLGALATNAGISAGVSKLVAKVGSIITPRSESTTTTAVPFSGGGSGSSTSSGGSGSSGPNYVVWIMGAFALFLGFIFIQRR